MHRAGLMMQAPAPGESVAVLHEQGVGLATASASACCMMPGQVLNTGVASALIRPEEHVFFFFSALATIMWLK